MPSELQGGNNLPAKQETDATGHLCTYLFFYPHDNDHKIVFNALTGGLYILDPSRYEELNKLRDIRNLQSVDKEFVQFCYDEKILVRDSEWNIIEERISSGRNRKEQLNITVMLTEACNLACKYCYQAKSPRRLTSEHARRLVAFVRNKAEHYDATHIHWFGGEPLLEHEMMFTLAAKITKEARSLGKRFDHSITTNASLITPSLAARLKEAGITHVQITLDGDDISHDKLRIDRKNKGSFKSVSSGLSACLASDIPVYVRVNLNRLTVDRVPMLLEFLASAGLNNKSGYIYFPETIKHTHEIEDGTSIFYESAKEYAHDLLKCLEGASDYGFGPPPLQPRSHYCSFDTNNAILFGVDAGLYFCTTGTNWQIAGIDERGNEHSTSPFASRDMLNSERCRGCEILPICMGGCAYLEKEGRPRCAPEKFILEPLIRLHVSQILKQRR